MSQLDCPTAPIHCTTLANGLRVVYQYVPAAVVAIDFWVGAGAAAEPEAYNGLAHALEHMVFQGSQGFPAGAFDQLIEKHGGMTNAATSQDYAHYYILTAPEYWREGLTALADILLRPNLGAQAWQKERAVIAEELYQAQDHPDWVGQQVLWRHCYGAHPYGRPILGTAESLARITPGVLRQFHQQYYHPGNMTVVVVGGVPWEPLEAVLAQVGAGERWGDATPPWICPLPTVAPMRSQLHLPQATQGRLWWVWPVMGVEDVAMGWGLDLLATLLTGGRLARLTQRLREELGWVQDIDCHYHHQVAGGVWQMTAWLNDAQRLGQVEAVLQEEVATLQEQLVSREDLRRAQRQLLHAYTFGTETPQQMARLYGYYHYMGCLEQGMNYRERLTQFRPEDLRSLAQTHLCPQPVVRLWLTPEAEV
ncbi:processing peptidase [Gloeomargarita lithophora Alchichica-D10]|uniref:Processing peptidase n=1 Tax=Gloeomargarita lithophora Alchichica-D10 TaxID=1188229 RepID=A0A1J0A9Q4_9CYAN|nr:pitrilysin family protein [Gloeomargarita lithophora]APB32674.1 processing peptidase [Gloeomargarita lithophora Alchichica-D10]